jgi:hypothetical protein
MLRLLGGAGDDGPLSISLDAFRRIVRGLRGVRGVRGERGPRLVKASLGAAGLTRVHIMALAG